MDTCHRNFVQTGLLSPHRLHVRGQDQIHHHQQLTQTYFSYHGNYQFSCLWGLLVASILFQWVLSLLSNSIRAAGLILMWAREPDALYFAVGLSYNNEIFMYIIKHRLQVCTIQSINPHSNEPIPDLLQCSVRCLKRVHARQKRARLCAIDSPRGKWYRLPSDPSIRPSIPIHLTYNWLKVVIRWLKVVLNNSRIRHWF